MLWHAGTTQRRIVRRAVIALTGVVLLVSLYVNAFFAVCWLDHNRGGYDMSWTNGVFAPIYAYCDSDLPGSETFNTVAFWFNIRCEVPLRYFLYGLPEEEWETDP